MARASWCHPPGARRARRNQAKGFVWGGTLKGEMAEEKARLLWAMRELPGLDSAWYGGEPGAEDLRDTGRCSSCGRCQCAPPRARRAAKANCSAGSAV